MRSSSEPSINDWAQGTKDNLVSVLCLAIANTYGLTFKQAATYLEIATGRGNLDVRYGLMATCLADDRNSHLLGVLGSAFLRMAKSGESLLQGMHQPLLLTAGTALTERLQQLHPRQGHRVGFAWATSNISLGVFRKSMLRLRPHSQLMQASETINDRSHEQQAHQVYMRGNSQRLACIEETAFAT